MAAPLADPIYSLDPPLFTYSTFSIDVTATLKLYCGGGNEPMLQKLDGLQDHKYAGYCLDNIDSGQNLEEAAYSIIVRPLQQGLTKPHPRKSHPSRSRRPFEVSGGSLPWENCYHPTCYDIRIRAPSERQDYLHSPLAGGYWTPELLHALEENGLHQELLGLPGLDDDRILRILNGQEEVPETDVPDDTLQQATDSHGSPIFLAEVPCFSELVEDYSFEPVMHINLVLSDVPQICDPSQLFGDLDLFQEIVQEYQLARYGTAVFLQPEPEIIPFPDDYSSESGPESGTSFHNDSFSEYDFECGTSESSTEDLSAEAPDLQAPDLSLANESDVSSNPPATVPQQKVKWRLKSVFQHTFKNLVHFLKGYKLPSKL